MKKLIGVVLGITVGIVALTGCVGEAGPYLGQWESSITVDQELESIGEISMTFHLKLNVQRENIYVWTTSKDEEANEELKTTVSDSLYEELEATMEAEKITEEEALANFEARLGIPFEEYVADTLDSIDRSFPTEVEEGEWVIDGEYIYMAKGTEDEKKFKVDGDGLVLEYGDESLEFEEADGWW